MPQLVRVHNFTISSDGYGAGEGQSAAHPFGHANPADLFFWAGATAHWPNRTDPGGTYGLDDYCARDFTNNIGAEIMGRNKFSPHRGPWETTTGRAGGAKPRPSTPPSSSSPTTPAPHSPSPTPHSTSSTPPPKRPSPKPSKPPTAKTSA